MRRRMGRRSRAQQGAVYICVQIHCLRVCGPGESSESGLSHMGWGFPHTTWDPGHRPRRQAKGERVWGTTSKVVK